MIHDSWFRICRLAHWLISRPFQTPLARINYTASTRLEKPQTLGMRFCSWLCEAATYWRCGFTSKCSAAPVVNNTLQVQNHCYSINYNKHACQRSILRCYSKPCYTACVYCYIDNPAHLLIELYERYFKLCDWGLPAVEFIHCTLANCITSVLWWAANQTQTYISSLGRRNTTYTSHAGVET